MGLVIERVRAGDAGGATARAQRGRTPGTTWPAATAYYREVRAGGAMRWYLDALIDELLALADRLDRSEQ